MYKPVDDEFVKCVKRRKYKPVDIELVKCVNVLMYKPVDYEIWQMRKAENI